MVDFFRNRYLLSSKILVLPFLENYSKTLAATKTSSHNITPP